MHPKTFRLKSGLSVPELADLLNVTPRAVYHWEEGRGSPRSRNVRAKYREISNEQVTGDDFGFPPPAEQATVDQNQNVGA